MDKIFNNHDKKKKKERHDRAGFFSSHNRSDAENNVQVTAVASRWKRSFLVFPFSYRGY